MVFTHRKLHRLSHVQSSKGEGKIGTMTKQSINEKFPFLFFGILFFYLNEHKTVVGEQFVIFLKLILKLDWMTEEKLQLNLTLHGEN